MKRHKIFYANMDLLHPMLNWVRSTLEELGVGRRELSKVELALEEALVNIMHHGYQDSPGDIEIQIASTLRKEAVIIIKDQGPPFNPLQAKYTLPDASTPLEEVQEGGLGIFFIKQCVDKIDYERKGPYNILTLTKKLKDAI